MQTLTFGTFSWPNNPSKLNLKFAKNLKDFYIPFNGTQLQNYGNSARILTGEGEFYGTSAFVSFFKLYDMFEENVPKDLFVPGFTNFSAYFSELNFIGEPGPECVKYSFTFIEDVFTKATSYTPSQDSYVTAQGDNLWDISSAFAISIEDLIRLNPSITDTIMPGGKELDLK